MKTQPIPPMDPLIPVQNPVVKPRKSYLWVFILLTFILLASAITLQYQAAGKTKNTAQNVQVEESKTIKEGDPTPTPFPFREMTIPYLRTRQYTSSIGELSLQSQNSAYTSYLTSYDSDGLRINAQLTRPTSEIPEGGWPAIVFVHGYIPPTQYETLSRYVGYVDYLAQRGFVVFKIDLRGHGSSEGEPGGAYYSSDYVIDTLNAYAALEAINFVNPKKIGIWGHSMAGNVALRSLAARPNIPAIAIWGGAVYSYEDRLKYGIQDGSYTPPTTPNRNQSQRQKLRELYGEFDNTKPFWQQVAATNYLNDMRGAISIHHAVDDSVVNVGYSRDLNALLDKTTVPHRLHEYPSGGHDIADPSFAQAMQDTVDFYNSIFSK